MKGLPSKKLLLFKDTLFLLNSIRLRMSYTPMISEIKTWRLIFNPDQSDLKQTLS